MRTKPEITNTDKLLLWLTLLVVIAVTSFGSYFAAKQRAQSLRNNMSYSAQTIAQALKNEPFAALTGSSEDINKDEYQQVRDSQNLLLSINSEIKHVFVAGERDNSLVFLSDDDKPTPEHYNNMQRQTSVHADIMRSVIHNKQTVILGPTNDAFGSYIVGFSPIPNKENNAGLAVGIYYSASNYYKNILAVTIAPILCGLTVITLIIFMFIMRKRQSQLTLLRSELVSVASHELRNPITGIRWAAEGLLNTRLDDSSRSLAQAIYNSAIGLQASTDDILDLSRALKNQNVAMASTNVTKIIKDIIITQVLPAKQRNVKIVLDNSWPPELLINCDGPKLKQALQNLLSNAVKYTRPNTQVTIRYAETPHEHHFLVGDEGIGIPESEQERVFEGFYRATNAVASKSPGSGLGLYLVRLVIEQQHGHISFVSQEGKGTVFTITLPK